MLDDHMKLAWQRWTEAEKLTRRLQREFLTIAEFGLMTTMTRKTGGFDLRYIACPGTGAKAKHSWSNGNALKQIVKNGL